VGLEGCGRLKLNNCVCPYVAQSTSPASPCKHQIQFTMADCLENFNSSEPWSCKNLVFQNCTNNLGLDFASLQNATEILQQYCPTDPRLFGTNIAAATSNNARLTNDFCKKLVPAPFTPYPTPDILARLQTWKFPLLQLASSIPTPPLGFLVKCFVLLHLMGDPIGTIRDFRKKLSRCEDHAKWFENCKVISRNNPPTLGNGRLKDEEWKALANICIAFDEWGEGYRARKVMTAQL
jgi:hypothetical protein